ncbi:MAG: hypothetical protein N5P05_003026 [Chroococcopsis gigantea SAG 12.99]|nr:hypothetical protein [Chroococcopsis gigantea SAG 12.99]
MKISFKVASDLKELDRVLDNFNELDQNAIPRQDWLQCQLALAEGFTNAVRHAHKALPPNTPIDIEFTLNPDSVEIRIWDHGEPFDLDRSLTLLAHKNDRFAGRGQGLPILQKVSTILNYRRTDDNRNCLLIVKAFSHE